MHEEVLQALPSIKMTSMNQLDDSAFFWSHIIVIHAVAGLAEQASSLALVDDVSSSKHGSWRARLAGFQVAHLLTVGAFCQAWNDRLWLSIWVFAFVRIAVASAFPRSPSGIITTAIPFTKLVTPDNEERSNTPEKAPLTVCMCQGLLTRRVCAFS